jgi:hypothetical protein
MNASGSTLYHPLKPRKWHPNNISDSLNLFCQHTPVWSLTHVSFIHLLG